MTYAGPCLAPLGRGALASSVRGGLPSGGLGGSLVGWALWLGVGSFWAWWLLAGLGGSLSPCAPMGLPPLGGYSFCVLLLVLPNGLGLWLSLWHTVLGPGGLSDALVACVLAWLPLGAVGTVGMPPNATRHPELLTVCLSC